MNDDYFIPQIFMTVIFLWRLVNEIRIVVRKKISADEKSTQIIGAFLGTAFLFGMLRWGDFYG